MSVRNITFFIIYIFFIGGNCKFSCGTEIFEPKDGSIFVYGQTVSFKGKPGRSIFFGGSIDYEHLMWESSIDNLLGEEPDISVPGNTSSTGYFPSPNRTEPLSIGIHTITATSMNMGGGFYESSDSIQITVIHPWQTYNFTQVTSNGFTARWSHEALIHNNKIWIFPGLLQEYECQGLPYTKTVYSSVDGISWNEEDPNNTTILPAGSQIVSWNNELYYSGGGIPHCGEDWILNDRIYKSSDGINWTSIGTFPGGGRHGHGMAVFRDKLWVIAGYKEPLSPTTTITDSNEVLFNDVWSSSDGTNWTQTVNSANWPARRNHATIVFQDKIWILGGKSIKDIGGTISIEYLNDIWQSLDGINWVQVTPTGAIWSPRAGHRAIVYEGKLYVLGGKKQDSTAGTIALDDIWVTENGTTWQQIQPVDGTSYSPRYGHSLVVFKDRIWIIGGRNIRGVSNPIYNDVWHFPSAINP